MSEAVTAAADRVAAVVVNWQRPQETLRCLESLARGGVRPRPIVVDNGSGEAGVAPIATARPDVEIVRLPHNLGFAAGVNVGIRRALAGGAEAVLLVNDDAEVEAGCVRHLVEAIEPAGVAAAGARIVVGGRPDLVWSAGEQHPRRRPVAAGPDDDRDREVAYATGCCLLLAAEAVQDVGLFDEAYFALFEELDWCRRARKAGWRIRYAHRAVAQHHLEHSLGASLSPTYHYLNTRNWLRFEETGRFPAGPTRRWWAALRVWWHEVKFVLEGGGDTGPRMRAVTAGARDYLARRWGAPPADLG